jgi:hypothetical protein
MIGWKRHSIFVLMMIACAIGVSARGQAICDFTSPESLIESAQFSFAYWHHDDGTTPGIDASTGQLTAKLDRIYDSPLFGYTTAFSTQVELDTLLAKSWLASGSMSYRYYISEELPLFVYAGVRLDAATFQVQPGFELRSGMGIGRLRDVTPPAKAQRIVEYLQSGGHVTRAVSSLALSQIADIVTRADSYDQAEEYVADVVSAIESDVGSLLDPAVVLAIGEELQRTDDDLFCGAILQGGVGYELIDPYNGPQDTLYVMSGDIARVPTANSQIRCRMSWSAPSSDVLGDSTAGVDLLYTASLSADRAVRAGYAIKCSSAELLPRATQTAFVEYVLGMNQSDLLLSLALSKKTGDPSWTVDVSISFAVDLL